MILFAMLTLCLSPVVTDGDTIRCANQTAAIRIAGIDAPDKSCRGRKFANCYTGGHAEATKALRNLLFGRRVTLRYYSGSTYGRRIAAVCAGGTNVSKYMIDQGFAIYKPKWTGQAVRYNCT